MGFVAACYFENLPPAFAEAASRRQVAPLCQRGVVPPFAKGGGGLWSCQYFGEYLIFPTANNKKRGEYGA